MDKIKANFSPKYCRCKCPLVEEKIDDIWKKVTEDNNRIYNGSKFRLHDIAYENDCLDFKIGLTDYKETVCTNFQDFMEEIFQYGHEHYLNKHACFADPIGVTAVVETKDAKLIAVKRAQWLGEGKGKYDTPGGHAEPEVGIQGFKIFFNFYVSFTVISGLEITKKN